MEPFHSTLVHSEKLKLKCKQKPQIQSLNQLYQKQKGSTCNYCHKGLSYSWGLTSSDFEPYTYQTMMQRGWRRCGTYYYKLDLEKSCCKQWTHRMDVNQFRIKRDQKKTIKKMMAWCYEPVFEMEEEKHQNGGKGKKVNEKHQHKQKEEKHNHHAKTNGQNQKHQKPKQQIKSTKMITELSQNTVQFITEICLRLNQYLQPLMENLIPKEKLSPQNLTKQWNFSCLEKLKCFPSKPQEKSDYYCNWAMLLYGVNKQKITKDFGLVELVKVIKEQVEKAELSKDYCVRLERGGYLLIQLGEKLKEDKEFEIIKVIKQQKPQKMDLEMNLQKPQQQEPHVQFPQQQNKEKISPQTLGQPPKIKKQDSSNQFQKLEPQYRGELIITSDLITFGKLKIHLVEAEESNESWRLYQRYCTKIHGKEDKGLSSYTNFLCERALSYEKEQKQGNQGQKYYLPAFDPGQTRQKKKSVTGTITKRQGCYHMKYYLEDKFIAVGVIDLLPNGLSSVYYFYQPQYKDHRLGVFSSLIEIQYIRYLSLTFPEFQYYYMGFYIHDNDKMKYKGDYEPFQLLCPLTYNFVTVDQRVWTIIKKVVRDGDKNIRLAPEATPIDPDMHFTTDLGLFIDKNIKITYRKKPLKLKDINPEFYLPVLMILKSYLKVFGKELFDILTFTF